MVLVLLKIESEMNQTREGERDMHAGHGPHGVKCAWNGASSDQGARLHVTISDLDGDATGELSGVTPAHSVFILSYVIVHPNI